MDEIDNIILTDETKVKLREEQSKIIKVIEAFAKLDSSKEWETLKDLVFNKSLASIERQMLSEVLTPEIKIDKLYRLQGEWAWAKQYSDVGRFTESLKKQLEEIKK